MVRITAAYHAEFHVTFSALYEGPSQQTQHIDHDCAGLMLAYRLRRRPNIKFVRGQCVVFAGMQV